MVKHLTFASNLIPPEKRLFEVVERKGIGHPDTLADGIAEAISIEYSNYCLKHFGIVLHQMLDKIMLLGGVGKFDFGIGEIIKPWRIILNGRLSDSFGGKTIPISDIQIQTTKNYLKSVVPRLDLSKGVEFISLTTSYSKNPRWFKPETIEDVPDAKHPYANDTSTCSGYWPLSITEKLSLLLEGYFYNSDGSQKFKYIGQDIKVMCVRKQSSIDITMCVPFFSIDTLNMEHYLSRKNKLYKELKNLAEKYVVLPLDTQFTCDNPTSLGVVQCSSMVVIRQDKSKIGFSLTASPKEAPLGAKNSIFICQTFPSSNRYSWNSCLHE